MNSWLIAAILVDSGRGKTHLTTVVPIYVFCMSVYVCVCASFLQWEWITGLTAHCLPRVRDCGSMSLSHMHTHYIEML